MADLPLIEAVGMTKEFSGVRVLNNVNVSVAPGEIFGVIGENGAGKSTFMKILSGIYYPTSGHVMLEGKKVDVKNPTAAKALGISMVPQEFNLVDSLTVFENVFLGYEKTRGPLLNKAEMRDRTKKILSELETDIDPDSTIVTLSVAQKQMVEIAKALVHDSNILIMDEPTTVLNKTEIQILFRIMGRLKERGVAIFYISHKLWEVKSICDRVLVLRDGDPITVDATDNLNEADMARAMVGRELNQVFPPKKQRKGEVVLKVDGLSDGKLLQDIGFELKKGQILGFAGLVGAGRTETAEAIMGLRHRSSGRITVSGKDIDIRGPRQAVDSGLAYLSEDRQGSGLIMNFDIPANVTLISLKNYIRGLIDKKREQIASDKYVDQFNVRAASLKAKLRFFSGGNQQKVYLAKWMDTKPQVLILDEPTRGIDVNAKMEIYRFIHSLADSGIACMVISSELEEIIGLCDDVIVMREGRITGRLSGNEINEEEIMFHATGIKEGVSA
jgi:ribose transport system ATP-binding protein